MTKLFALSAACFGAAIVAAPAAAVDIQLDTLLTATSTPTCVLGACQLQVAHGQQSFEASDWNVGDTASLLLGKVSVSSGFGGDDDAALDLQIEFTKPAADLETGGAVVQYLHAFGYRGTGLTLGSINWDDPDWNFTVGGYGFELALQDVSGLSLGTATSIYGQLTLTSVPIAAVPEPASWALALAGFGIVGGTLRGRRKTAVAFA